MINARLLKKKQDGRGALARTGGGNSDVALQRFRHGGKK